MERLWEVATALHPGWEHVDLRDPIDRSDFPLASDLWDTCTSGSQKSDLIRFEELYHRGGFYIDSDVVCFRPFDGLLGLDAAVSYEDVDHICCAVMGFTPGHPALEETLKLARERHDQGAWAASIGIISAIWPGRDDMAFLPPGSFFPVHYHARWNDEMPPSEEVRVANPWAYCHHLWEGSWLEK